MNRLRVVAGAALVVLTLGVVLPGSLSAQTRGSPAAPTPESLDVLLAPVALYPDQLLAQMLLCATNTSQVRELATWLKQMTSVKGSALQEAAQKAGFEPSFVALSLFPQVVEFMATDLAWTTQLGQVFSADRGAVFASIQRLRVQSKAVGNLKSTPQQSVETRTTESGQQVIVIEPANPQVVYVPQYNPQIVYTQPATSTTVIVQEEDHDNAAVAGVVGFAAGVAIGAAIDNDYYYGPYGWHGGAYMYNDAWDDWYDDREDAREDWYENREDAREDWQDNQEDLANERGERADTAQQQRTERQQTRQSPEAQAQREQRRTEAQGAVQQARSPEAQAQREQRRTDAQGTAQQARSSGATATSQARSAGSSSYESRGYSGGTNRASGERSGTRSDAFSNYSSSKSTRSASARGQRSRSSGGGGRSGGSRGGGGRRR
jgi:hypothetical protein